MPKLNSLHDLFIDQTKDLLGAEKLLTKALGKMVKKCNSDDLRNALSEHIDVTERQIGRLEQIQRDLGLTPKGKRCLAMEGLVSEGQEIMDMDGLPEVLDAGIIAASQKIEHYEIASYGTLRTYAETLGYSSAAKLLNETLQEEESADKTLSQIAENHINQEALLGTGESGAGVSMMSGSRNLSSSRTIRNQRNMVGNKSTSRSGRSGRF